MTLPRANIAWTYAFKGVYARALTEIDKLPQRPTPSEDQLVAGETGFVFAVSGRRREALDIITQFKKLSESRYVDSYMVGTIYAALGDNDRAFDSLNKAREERSASMAFFKSDPFFDKLRSDARYSDLLRRIGLPQ